MKAGSMERLVGVDVAETGEAGLIEQGRLDGAALARAEALGEQGGGEVGTEGVGTVLLLGNVGIGFGGHEEARPGEAALVIHVEDVAAL